MDVSRWMLRDSLRRDRICLAKIWPSRSGRSSELLIFSRPAYLECSLWVTFEGATSSVWRLPLVKARLQFRSCIRFLANRGDNGCETLLSYPGDYYHQTCE